MTLASSAGGAASRVGVLRGPWSPALEMDGGSVERASPAFFLIFVFVLAWLGDLCLPASNFQNKEYACIEVEELAKNLV